MQKLFNVLFLSLFVFSLLVGCGGGGKEEGGILYAFKEDFIVNLAKEDMGTYLKVQIGVEVSDKKTLGEIGRMEFKIRDRLNYILSRQSLKTISTDTGKDNIKREIKESINKVLDTGEITDVFFYEFVSQ